MTMRVTILSTVMGQSGSLLEAGSTYSVGDQFGQELVNSGRATDTDRAMAVPQTELKPYFATDPLTGAVTGLVGPGGVDAMGGYIKGNRSPIPGVGGASLSLADVSIVTGAPTITLETGPNGAPAIKIVSGVGVNAEIKFNSLVGTYSGGDAYLSMSGSYSQTNVDSVVSYVSQDAAGYAKGWANTVQYALVSPNGSSKEQGGAVTYFFKKSSNSNFGSPTYPAYVADHKLRITPRAATSATVWIYAYGFSAPRTKGRICVTWDDGYDSMFKLGYDSFASRNIKQTLSVIGSVQGTGGGHSNIDQLSAFVNAGNALVAHGPWPSSGAGNLLTAYPASTNPVADAIADMKLNLNYLRTNGLIVPGADKCYVWPQGVFQQSVNDTAILDAAISAGFTLCRGVATSHVVNADAASKYGRMALPIIGHSWAGTTAAEATNITAITTAITALTTDRSDGFLMLHRVQPTTTADGSMLSTGIRHGDLETIAAAIKTAVDAGTLEAVTMAELAMADSGYWGKF